MTHQHLTDFAHNFFGYGNLDAPLWFVGMEEGGGHSRNEIERRIDSWASRRDPVVDIVGFGRQAHLDEHLRWFGGDKPPLQSTWSQLIRIALGRQNQTTDASTARAYQRDHFARADRRECLLELLPLPSPSVGAWKYGEWFTEPWLDSRDAYREKLLDHRIDRLRTLIDEHQPEAVVFYSLSYLEHWTRIAGEFREHPLPGDANHHVWFQSADSTRFVVCQHPAAFGATNAYFEAVGRLLSDD